MILVTDDNFRDAFRFFSKTNTIIFAEIISIGCHYTLAMFDC